MPFKRSLHSNQKQNASSFSFIFFCSKVCEGELRSAICLWERPASCAGTSAGGQWLTYHISSKWETACRRNQKLSSTFWVVNQTQTSSSITAFALNRLNQVWLKIDFVYLNCCKCSDWTLWKGYPQIRQTEAWGTHTPTHGLASTSHMRAAISPGQWQSATQPFLVSSRNAPPHIFCFNSYRVYRSSTT